MRLAVVVATVAAGVAIIGDASARAGDNPWADAKVPVDGPARAIGGYSAGCVQGAVELPADGRGFQVVRPSRRRVFGHPLLIETIEALGARVRDAELGVLLIGDLGQPRGGPAPTGHKSHQSGLDVDIYYWYPVRAVRKPLSRRDRERIEPPSLVNAKTNQPTKHLTARVREVLRLAATDARVARIFVNPVIKRELCEAAGDDREWLRKLRPWWGHAAHFHLRLECPPDSPECEPQEVIPEGDGCAEIEWWLSEERREDRAKSHGKYREGIGAIPELPASCAALVDDS